jgi:hypothetical protein
MSRYLCHLWLILAALLAPSPAAAAPNGSAESFRFALFGDPQMGFGPGGVYADVGRFIRIIEHSNSAKLPVILIPGDLVQTRSIWQRRAFSSAKLRIKGQVLITPGNHDVVDMASLKAFRENFGPDYHDLVYKNSAFILINSETAITPGISQSEFDSQWRWLEKTCDHHSRAKRS